MKTHILSIARTVAGCLLGVATFSGRCASAPADLAPGQGATLPAGDRGLYCGGVSPVVTRGSRSGALAPEAPKTLSDLVGIAMENNPDTRVAWTQAEESDSKRIFQIRCRGLDPGTDLQMASVRFRWAQCCDRRGGSDTRWRELWLHRDPSQGVDLGDPAVLQSGDPGRSQSRGPGFAGKCSAGAGVRPGAAGARPGNGAGHTSGAGRDGRSSAQSGRG